MAVLTNVDGQKFKCDNGRAGEIAPRAVERITDGSRSQKDQSQDGHDLRRQMSMMCRLIFAAKVVNDLV